MSGMLRHADVLLAGDDSDFIETEEFEMEMEQIKERYELSAARLRELLGEESVKEPYRDYFKQVSGFILETCLK